LIIINSINRPKHGFFWNTWWLQALKTTYWSRSGRDYQLSQRTSSVSQRTSSRYIIQLASSCSSDYGWRRRSLSFGWRSQRKSSIIQKQANARIKQGPNSPYYMKDAYAKYTEAINLNPKTPELKAKLHCNRAAINLKFHNYGKVI